MKEYIKALITGAIAGAAAMQIINLAAQAWLDRPFTMGGEVFLPALIGMVGYIGWMLADSYFRATKYKEIYSKGFNEGVRVNKYKIIIPVEEESAHERKESA